MENLNIWKVTASNMDIGKISCGYYLGYTAVDALNEVLNSVHGTSAISEWKIEYIKIFGLEDAEMIKRVLIL